MKLSFKYAFFLFHLTLTNCSIIFGQGNIDTIKLVAVDSIKFRRDIRFEIDQKIDSLKLLGVNKIISYFSDSDGYPKYLDSLGVYDIRYLLWEQNSKVYTQKFVDLNDVIFERPSKKLSPDQNIFKFLIDNYNTIRSEVIQPFIIKDVINGIESYGLLLGTHQTYTLLKICNNEDQFEKSIKDVDLIESLGDDLINVNYLHNNSTKLKTLLNLISAGVLR